MIFIEKQSSGFTLIELLVVISIIGLLSTLATVGLNGAKIKARDAKRFHDMSQMQKALEVYFSNNGFYPTSDYDGCGGWDVGNITYQFLTNKLPGIINPAPNDPMATDTCNGYRYYRYGAGNYGCDPARGAYYVLGVTNLEATGMPHSTSPGWSCPSRNWQGEMEWVTGKFEK